MRNNRKIYEFIIRDVSKIISKHINENLFDDLYDIEQENDVTIEVADKIYNKKINNF